jgi:hypothetical protein
MPDCVVDIFYPVGFELVNVGILISLCISRVPSGIMRGLRKISEFIRGGYTYRTSVAVDPMDHHILHMICQPGREFGYAAADFLI